MKKLIALFLALILTMSLLGTVAFADDPAFEDPMETTQAQAAVKVTTESDSSLVLYFETLDQNVLAWTCLNVPGKKTITLLKDMDLTGTIEGFPYLMKVPNDNGSWYGRTGSKNTLVVDLGGKTLTYTGEGSLFFVERYGFMLKNGTINYKGTSADTAVVQLSRKDGRTAITAGTSVWAPAVTLQNVNLYNLTGNGSVLLNYQYSPKITIKDSFLWADGSAISMKKTDQSNLDSESTIFEGDYKPSVNVETSVLGSTKTYPITTSDPGVEVTGLDFALVAGAADYMVADSYELDTMGMDGVQTPDWNQNTEIGLLSGNAYLFGDAPSPAVVLPFTDVQDTDWFYTFVSELYGKKIIAGQTATTFNPNGNLTYAAALKLLVVGLTGTDVGNAASGHWATKYLEEATVAGWTDIDAAKLDTPITREAFCEIAAKAMSLTEQPETNKVTDTTNPAVLALVKAGVINGMNETTFQPEGILTRAQISKIISLLLKLK